MILAAIFFRINMIIIFNITNEHLVFFFINKILPYRFPTINITRNTKYKYSLRALKVATGKINEPKGETWKKSTWILHQNWRISFGNFVIFKSFAKKLQKKRKIIFVILAIVNFYELVVMAYLKRVQQGFSRKQKNNVCKTFDFSFILTVFLGCFVGLYWDIRRYLYESIGWQRVIQLEDFICS